jgi:hypothetical protein
MTIKERLVSHGFTSKQIERFMIVYSEAIELKIPYPYYYAILKTVS